MLEQIENRFEKFLPDHADHAPGMKLWPPKAAAFSFSNPGDPPASGFCSVIELDSILPNMNLMFEIVKAVADGRIS